MTTPTTAKQQGEGQRLLEYVSSKWSTEDVKNVVVSISEGQYLPTMALLMSPNKQYRVDVIQAGAVERIMEFIIKSNKPFYEVLPPASTADASDFITAVPCPSIWVQVLSNVCRDGFLPPPIQTKTRAVVVNNLSGVFQDMTDTTARTFFGSTDIWYKTLPYFCGLLSSLLTCQDPGLADFLLKQSRMKEFMVHIIYMEVGNSKLVEDIDEFSHERDTRTPKPDIVGMSQSHCAFAIKVVCLRKGRDVLGDFAVVPIGPEHELRMATGMIKLLDTNVRDAWYEGGFASMLTIFLQLFDWGGRISAKFGVQCVSANLIPICNRHIMKYASAPRDQYFFENVSTSIVVIGATLMTPVAKTGKLAGQQAPIDFNVAAATYQGLFEYCLDICDCNDGRLMKPLDGFLKIVSHTVNLPATKKAIRAKEKDIRAKIARVKDRLPYLLECLNGIEEMLDAAVKTASDEERTKSNDASVEREVETCEFCYEKCIKGTTTKCRFCKSIGTPASFRNMIWRALYCSKDCSQLNWKSHQQNCGILRKYPPAQPSEQIEKEGKYIFSQHVHKILLQASLKGFSILYCIVVIDMVEATPLFRTLTPEQFNSSYGVDEDISNAAKNALERNKTDGSLTVSFVGFTEEGLAVSVNTFPPETAPVHLAPSALEAHDINKWSAAQQEISSASMKTGGLQHLQRNQDVWKASIMKSMKP